MEDGLHGEVSVNVPSHVEEDTKNATDHALLLHPNMVVNHVSDILNTLLTATTIHAKVGNL